MPTKETKETIEAELNASLRDRILAELHGVIASIDEFERELQLSKLGTGCLRRKNQRA
jgi:hypothetical protein